tara:strand:+ start:2062 stop:2412 length:351 start_codon:yes stop_codon:yes gene_type:complete
MRNIIEVEDGKMVHSSRFEVDLHIIAKNFWEYYLEEPDSNGIAFGYVMGDFNEWGSVDVNELKPYIISSTRNLDEVMPPVGYQWEDELQDVQLDTVSVASETHSPLSSGSGYSTTE